MKVTELESAQMIDRCQSLVLLHSTLLSALGNIRVRVRVSVSFTLGQYGRTS